MTRSVDALRPGAGLDVSIVIVTFNGLRWLDGCLKAITTRKADDVEIVLVDNGSTDGSAEWVAEQYPQVRVVRLDRNLGFAGGNNAGARLARGRLLAFLNNDTEADVDWIAALRRAIDARPGFGLATSRIVYMHDPSVVDSAGDGYTRAGGAFKRGHGQPSARYDESREVFGACGAAFMIKREIFEELGGFDEDLFLVYEDVDLSYRAQLRHYRCVYVSDAIVRHAGSATMGSSSRASVFYGQRNLEWVYWKNTPWPLLLLTVPGHAIYALAGGVYLGYAGHFGTWCAAKREAIAGLPSVLRKRRLIQRSRRTRTGRLWGLMERRWVGAKWGEKTFDLGMSRASGSP